MSLQTIQNEGIYHGLPTYPSDVGGLTAVITGANGISGFHLAKVLASAPERWSKIYCLSRKPPPEYFYDGMKDEAAKNRVEHIAIDFLRSVEEIVEKLKKVGRVDHVLLFSYIQPKQKGGVGGMWSEADALVEANTRLLSNLLSALRLSNLTPKRFLLQTGAKHYGFHIGPATNPSFETDPRITLEPNFYYPQEDLLYSYCEASGASWNIIRPSYIIGAVRYNYLNFLPGVAVYAAVQAHLGRKLDFPGDFACWDKEMCLSTAMLNGYFAEWAVLNEHAANEAFNIHDGLNFTWSRFWPYLASWYGLPWKPPSLDEEVYRTVEGRHEETPRGYGRAVSRSTFSLQEWSESSEVVEAWNELKEKYDLVLDPFKDRAQVFGMSDSAILGGWPLSLSMRKARKFGFHGTVDSFESTFVTLQSLARMRVVVPMVKNRFEEVA